MEKTEKEAVMSPRPLVILVHEIYGVNSHIKGSTADENGWISCIDAEPT